MFRASFAVVDELFEYLELELPWELGPESHGESWTASSETVGCHSFGEKTVPLYRFVFCLFGSRPGDLVRQSVQGLPTMAGDGFLRVRLSETYVASILHTMRATLPVHGQGPWS